MKILVTGGAGYIGSHTCVELLKLSHKIIIYDNFSNSSFEIVKKIEEIADCACQFECGDILDTQKLAQIFKEFNPDCVVHFAGLKSVSDSVLDPLLYHDVNVQGTINVINAMKVSNCRNLIFSSSATVYGDAKYLPIDEGHPIAPLNPYGNSKQFVEAILKNCVDAHLLLNVICLRYFNPIGAHDSGLIGESPTNKPNNIMPVILDVAMGKREQLSIYGADYATRDGTGERDYVHVVDLAQAHARAAEVIDTVKGFKAVNIGTGHGTTVLELIHAFENVTSQKIRIKIEGRRFGDIATSIADPTQAEQLLSFRCSKSIYDMCLDAWNWQTTGFHIIGKY
jgi:UDP-glucose 4-epimerase